MLIISSWLYPKCTFILLYTTLNLKTCKINCRKKCVTFLRGSGGSPEERSYDVSRGQNRYVTLPLIRTQQLQYVGQFAVAPSIFNIFGSKAADMLRKR